MAFAARYGDEVQKLIIEDVAPRFQQEGKDDSEVQSVADALAALPLDKLHTR